MFILVGRVDNQVIASSSSSSLSSSTAAATTTTADRVCLIDFDWSGKEGAVITYPCFMNHFDVNWPERASDNEIINKTHDLDFLMTYKPNEDDIIRIVI